VNRRASLLATGCALLVVLGAALAAATQLTQGWRAFTAEDLRRLRVAAAPVPLSGIAVVDSAGARRQLWNSDPQVRAWLVAFVYTRCPAVCQALGSEFERLQALTAPVDGVRLASLSFDRAHDSPGELAAYARRYRVDPQRWLVAVPESDAALTRLLRETGVVVIQDAMGGYAHNAAIHVVTASGRLVALFDLEHYREALAYARAL
jgi:protein SCO1/2